MNTRRIYYKIKVNDRVLLLTKNLTDKKLNRLYIKAFEVEKVLKVVVILKLLDISIFFKFYIEFLKKVLLKVPLAKY